MKLEPELTREAVEALLGAPSKTEFKDGVMTWFYEAPPRTLAVVFKKGRDAWRVGSWSWK
jgi:hypothetical protein